MALLNVTEFAVRTPGTIGGQPVAVTPAITSYDLAVAGGSLAGPAFSSLTCLVRINCDVACRIVFGESPTALGDSTRLTAGTTEYYDVTPNQKVAVIAST